MILSRSDKMRWLRKEIPIETVKENKDWSGRGKFKTFKNYESEISKPRQWRMTPRLVVAIKTFWESVEEECLTVDIDITLYRTYGEQTIDFDDQTVRFKHWNTSDPIQIHGVYYRTKKKKIKNISTNLNVLNR